MRPNLGWVKYTSPIPSSRVLASRMATLRSTAVISRRIASMAAAGSMDARAITT
jgi:hypothetical protein